MGFWDEVASEALEELMATAPEDVRPEEVMVEGVGIMHASVVTVKRETMGGLWREMFRPAVGTRPPKGWTCSRAEEHLVLREDGKPVSFLGLLARRVAVNGKIVLAGGLGFGATLRGHEGRGYMTRLTEEGTALLRKKGAAIILITCLDTLRDHYIRLGWEEVPRDRVTILQPEDGRDVPPQVYVFARIFDESLRPLRLVDFRGYPW